MQPGKWRLRQPRWMQMQRAHMLMLFRAIQAVKFRGTTTDSPKLPLSCIPATYKVRLSNCKLPTFLNLERHRRGSAMTRSLDLSNKICLQHRYSLGHWKSFKGNNCLLADLRQSLSRLNIS